MACLEIKIEGKPLAKQQFAAIMQSNKVFKPCRYSSFSIAGGNVLWIYPKSQNEVSPESIKQMTEHFKTEAKVFYKINEEKTLQGFENAKAIKQYLKESRNE